VLMIEQRADLIALSDLEDVRIALAADRRRP